ncbi:unnamed protein product [Blepharisma stoltei]|uniref:Photosystem I assembly protein Ycf3 n=1 Tax=Blepharisma stoltei TaxID=1481888 RepID=A0AAU9JDK7_9CILI|nr:unnamed protein product [Blepharisma stoltei]
MTERSTESTFSRTSRLSEDEILHYNKIAMDYLREGDYDSSMNYLKQAFSSIKSLKDTLPRQKLLAITYNNLGCFFKRTGNHSEALNYLFKAVEMEKNLPNEFANIAGSHLNICAILSNEGEHERALRHALKSLYLLKNNYNSQPGLISTLIIAYHNVGAEYEYLMQFPDAADCYRRGWELSKDHLGLKNSLTMTLKKSFVELTEKMKNNGDMKSESQSEKRAGKVKRRDPRSSVPPPKGEKLPVVQIGNAYQRAISHEGSRTFNSTSLDETRGWKNLKIQQNRHRSHHEDAINTGHTTRSSTSSQNSPNSTINSQRRNIKIITQKQNLTVDLNTKVSIFKPRNLSERVQRSERLTPVMSSKKKKINLLMIKAQERTAAIMIQSWWRGVKARKKYAQIKIDNKLKEAEIKARKAVEEYEKLKRQASQFQRYRVENSNKSKNDSKQVSSSK